MKHGLTRSGRYIQGFFVPQNPQKYRGDPTQIIYRSGWELKVFRYLDQNKMVLEWQSEELHIPYRSPLDGRIHRYLPDALARIQKPDGTVETVMLEIKPKSQTRPPNKKKNTKRYLAEVKTWGVNEAKWKAASEYCTDRGWKFVLITEDSLGLNK